MKTKKQVTKQLLSILLCLALMLTYVPMTVFAASASPEYDASGFLHGEQRPAVYANGNDLIIEAGSTSGTTSVYYMSGGTKTAVVENLDLSNAYIFAGYNDSATSMADNVTITMCSGSVNRIYAGHRTSGSVYGNITIIMMEGANVQTVIPYSAESNTAISGKMRLFAANGLKGAVMAGRSFDGQVVKKSSGWSVTGDAVVPADCTMDIAEGTTATVASGTTLTNNGSIVNNGTIHLQKSFTQLKGTEPTGSGSYIVNLPYVANASAVTAASMDCADIAIPGYRSLGGKLYLDVSQGKVWATIDGTEYYCDFTGAETAMQPYTSVTAISGMTASMNANTSTALVASALPANVLAQNITYEIVDAGTTGATLSGKTLTAPFGGTVRLSATATDGYRVFTKEFDMSVNQTVVTGIANDSAIPTSAEPSSVALPTQVLPADATYKTIVWTVTGPATVSGNTLKLSGAGTVKLTATVKNGLGNGQDYTKTYTIAVSAPTALDISYGDITIKKAQSGGGHTVTYYNANGQQQTQPYDADQLIVITGTTTENRITIESGSPKLVLKNCSIQLSQYQAIYTGSNADGVEITLEGANILKAETGIYVSGNASLTIDGNGSLTATGSGGPGIGSGANDPSGTIIINGGTVNATGSINHAGIGGRTDGNSKIIINDGNVTASGGNYAAGIGGRNSHSGTVTINGGTVTATGGNYAAGIGGGNSGAGNVTITGGTVTATGGNYAAGIGGGHAYASTVTISGGEVTATGGKNGAGIGGGEAGEGTVTINGGTVDAIGGEEAAGIGGGKNAAGTVTITAGKVTAKTDTDSNYGGAGIGGGYNGKGDVTISGGTVEAIGGNYGAGIGGGYKGAGTATIEDGTVTATGGEDGAGIGGGYGGAGTVTISGGEVTAIGGNYGAGIGSNFEQECKVTIEGGKVTAAGDVGAAIGTGYSGTGTVTISDGEVIATGGYGAGIGSGYSGTCDVTISGGKVTAAGGAYGSGIGAGYNGTANVTIRGGEVTATGDVQGAAIGAGSWSEATVTVSGGTIEAVSVSGAAGIDNSTITITGGSLKANGDITATNGEANGSQSLTVIELTIDQLPGDEAIASAAGLPSYYGLKDVQTMDKKLYFYLPSEYPANITTNSGDIYYHAGNGLYTDNRHEWNYSVNTSLDTITATCIASNCSYTDGGSMTLNASDVYYTGSENGATVTGSFTNGATYKLTYNGSETAPSSIGTHTAKLTVSENGIEKQSVSAEYKISYLPAPNPAYTINGGYQNGATYWLKTGATAIIVAPDGYTVSAALNGTYESSVSFSESDSKVIYLKRTSDGALTDAINVEGIRFDGTGATGKITIESRGIWEKLLNKITFGLFFKGDAVAKVEATDVDSGWNSIQYYVANTDLINDAELTDSAAISALDTAIGSNWSNYNSEIALNKNAKNIVYVKITDNVGNVTYLSSEGILLYSDAQAVTESVSAACKAGADKEVTVELNGNTVKEIKIGTAVLTAGTDYTVSADGKITLKSAYLDTLNAGTYTFTVSYNPLGMEYVEANGNDAPAATTFTVVIEKADGEVTNINMSGKTYDGSAVTAPTFDKLGDGMATIEYKVKGADDSTYTTTAPKNAGDYVVRVTVAEGTNYKAASAMAEFSIAPVDIKDAIVTLDQNVFIYNGTAHKPTVTVTFNGTALREGVDYEVLYLEAMTVAQGKPTKWFGYGDTSVDCIDANNYYYAVVMGMGNYYTADNLTLYANFVIQKATVTEPTIDSKPYNGSVQTADINETDFYTVVKNDGGTGVKLNGYYDVVLELKDAANYKWSSTDDAQVTLKFAITSAENEWTVYPSISGWTYGETAKAPVGAAKFGEVSVEYTGTANDGTSYRSSTAPTKAGNYTATFIVQGEENYSGLETSVDFTIAKATYNMSGAKWNYSEPFRYDGKEHKVEVVGLPAGVTVESYENNTATAASDYYAKANLAYDADNYNAPTINVLGWTIYNDWTPTEYTVNGSGWTNKDFVITANDGYKVALTDTADGDWKDSLIYSEETADGSVTFYLKNETDGTISLAKTVSYKLDKTVPTGKVEFVERSSWEEFVNTITFGLFYKDEVTVKVTENDNLSGVAKIEYASSDKAMTLDEVKAITDWTEYTDSFGVTLEDAKKFVYFVRITDKAGNETYLSTDGAEYDTTAPVISGVENGGVYHGDWICKAIDENILKIEVDGVDITDTTEGDDEFTIVADNAEHTVTVTDKAGNVTEYKITVYKKYMVTFSNGDGGSYEKEFKYGEVITVPTNEIFNDTFRKTGYTLTGWQGYTEGMTMPLDNLTFTAVYVPCEYIVTFDTNGGETIVPLTVTFGEKYGSLPSSAVAGLSGGNKNWYLVDADGNVTETNIKNLTLVSTSRDHTIFIKRNVLAPNVSIALTVPGGISDGYQYYIPGASQRILTATVRNSNTDILAYTYQWYKDGTPIEGATSNVLTLDGNVSDSGTYKVEVTATLKDGANIVVTSDTATASKEQKVKIMHATNTLRYDANGGEGGPQSSYTGGTSLKVSKNAPTREYCNFLGWNTAADGTGDSYKAEDVYTFADDNGNGGCVVTLYAEWKLVEYTVTYEADGESVSTEMVEHGKDAVLPDIPEKDGFIGKWNSDGKNITEDTTISVIYTAIPVVDPDEVKPEDKTNLEDTKAKLDEMLDDSYTEDDKKKIQDTIDNIDAALEVIENVENVENLIGKLPDTIKKDDEAAIKAADDAYNALSDYEKTLVDEDAKKALDDAKAALAELNKPADPNSPATGDNSTLWLWVALLFVSGTGIFGITLYYRKRRTASKR